jgi:hypothetical protein
MGRLSLARDRAANPISAAVSRRFSDMPLRPGRNGPLKQGLLDTLRTKRDRHEGGMAQPAQCDALKRNVG